MANIIPDRWKHALADLRDDIQQAIRRWLPTRHAHNSDTSTLPVRVEHAVDHLRDDLHDLLERWLPVWASTPGRERLWKTVAETPLRPEEL